MHCGKSLGLTGYTSKKSRKVLSSAAQKSISDSPGYTLTTSGVVDIRGKYFAQHRQSLKKGDYLGKQKAMIVFSKPAQAIFRTSNSETSPMLSTAQYVA